MIKEDLMDISRTLHVSRTEKLLKVLEDEANQEERMGKRGSWKVAKNKKNIA